MPIASPEGATRAANFSVVVPEPQPMSSTRSPGFGAAKASPRFGHGRVVAVALFLFLAPRSCRAGPFQ